MFWVNNMLLFIQAIQLNFIQVALLQCFFDRVNIYDGYNSSSPSLGVICGHCPENFTSTSNVLYIEFITDEQGHDAGFEAVYHTVDAGMCYESLSLLAIIIVGLL